MAKRNARLAKPLDQQLPPIRRLETPAEEARLLKVLKVSSVEEIRDFDRAITLLNLRSKEDGPA
jgi:hypothetical protein